MDIAAAKKRCKAASETPWTIGHEPQLNMVAECGDTTNGQSMYIYAYHLSSVEADAEFIAHARTDLPTTLEELEEAQAQISQMVDGGACPARDPNGECVELNAAISGREEAQRQLAEALQDKAYVEDELKRRNHQYAEAEEERGNLQRLNTQIHEVNEQHVLALEEAQDLQGRLYQAALAFGADPVDQDAVAAGWTALMDYNDRILRGSKERE